MIAVERGNKEKHITSQCWNPLVKVRVGPEETELAYIRNLEKIRRSLRAGVGHVLTRVVVCIETEGRMQCEIKHRSVTATGEVI